MGGQNSKNETGRKEISSAPADARSWSRCDYVFAWMAEQQAPSGKWLPVNILAANADATPGQNAA